MTPQTERLKRLSVTAEFRDGTTRTWAADDPENPELDITIDPRLPDIRGREDLFRMELEPPLLRVAVRFSSAPGRPVRTVIHASGSYECPLAGCPWPLVKGSELDVQAHVLAHAMLDKLRDG